MESMYLEICPFFRGALVGRRRGNQECGGEEQGGSKEIHLG